MKITILCIALAAVPLVIGTAHEEISFRDAMRKLRLKPNNTRQGGLSGGPDDFLPLSFPYQVKVQDVSFGSPFHICSGSILSEKWVLTAAHYIYVDALNHDIFQIVAGDQDEFKQAVKVSQIIIHEGYDIFTSTNDVALLKLATPLAFNDFVQPIPLPQQNQIASGSCNIFGATVSIAPETDYIGILRTGGTRNDCLIYAELVFGSLSAWEGNSAGSPLVCSDGTGYEFLAGIRGTARGSAESLILYNEVACFADWIRLHMAS